MENPTIARKALNLTLSVLGRGAMAAMWKARNPVDWSRPRCEETLLRKSLVRRALWFRHKPFDAQPSDMLGSPKD